MAAPLLDLNSAAFVQGLAAHVAQMKIDGEKGLTRIGFRVQNAARKRCPVDTGRLRSSIIAKPGRDARGPYVDIGTSVVYAVHVEFGTSRQQAQPFLRPGFAAAVGFYPQELGNVGG